ncbi:hypothetical protein BLNAU_7306 [Blattamonas nauphoetae]|uniref:Uncharacterized protein n=1 Tax=Blattamonas nauphoetae TaxID=2049346 RepID=A0ABQ9Y1P3_9EUKA|nr:hypothetical protein BLNAU_7306 [Blattamonas nauphoetae]
MPPYYLLRANVNTVKTNNPMKHTVSLALAENPEHATFLHSDISDDAQSHTFVNEGFDFSMPGRFFQQFFPQFYRIQSQNHFRSFAMSMKSVKHISFNNQLYWPRKDPRVVLLRFHISSVEWMVGS